MGFHKTMKTRQTLIIEALSEKALTRNELLEITKLPPATLHRYLIQLQSENVIQGKIQIRDNREIVVYDIPDKIKIHRPLEAFIVEDTKRVKGGKIKVIPLKH